MNEDKESERHVEVKRWNTFGAEEFVGLMRPSIITCRLCGHISYRIANHRIENSRIGRLYCSIITLAYLSSSIIILYAINASKKIKRSSEWMIKGNCFYAFANFMILANYVFGDSVVRVLQILSDTAANLPQRKLQKITRWIYLKDLTAFLLLFLHIPNVFSRDLGIFFWKAIGTYATVSVFLLDLQYNNYVFVIATCFQEINDELVRIKDSVFTEQAHLLRRVYHNQYNPILFVKLRFLKKWHYELNEIIKKINSTFSLQLIASTVVTFSDLTFGLYFYFLDLRQGGFSSLDKEIWYYYYYTKILYFSLKLLLLTLTCQFANNENYRTRVIINEILINTDDKLFKEELNLFSLQLLHADNVFVAKGVALDATLLTSMSKGIFTYVLILIQFKVMN